MKTNTQIISSSSKENFINQTSSNSDPDIIDQVDKVINKYKNQLEQLKPKKESNKENIINQYYPSSNFLIKN